MVVICSHSKHFVTSVWHFIVSYVLPFDSIFAHGKMCKCVAYTISCKNWIMQNTHDVNADPPSEQHENLKSISISNMLESHVPLLTLCLHGIVNITQLKSLLLLKSSFGIFRALILPFRPCWFNTMINLCAYVCVFFSYSNQFRMIV